MKPIFLIFCLFSVSYSLFAQAGCTDPQANNYDENAIENDGSCTYNITDYFPQLKTNLAEELEELSGMITYNNRIFGIPDSGNPHALYEFDTITGAIIDTKTLIGTDNVDWESLAIDKQYVYIGDTGNNKHGNRQDLVIYRFPVSELDSIGSIASSKIDRIFYSYEDQVDFTALDKNSTRYDCESIISFGDSIYLFSKDWQKFMTRYYTIPKVPGTHSAILHDSLAVNGIVTDATILGDSIVVLVGSLIYSYPFVEILSEFKGHDVFSGNKRQIVVKEAALGQPESITINESLTGFIGTESFNFNGVSHKQAIFNYSIHDYLTNPLVPIEELVAQPKLTIFPNPVKTATISYHLPQEMAHQIYRLTWVDGTGKILDSRMVTQQTESTFVKYQVPPNAKSGTNYLVLETDTKRYVGGVQLIR